MPVGPRTPSARAMRGRRHLASTRRANWRRPTGLGHPTSRVPSSKGARTPIGEGSPNFRSTRAASPFPRSARPRRRRSRGGARSRDGGADVHRLRRSGSPCGRSRIRPGRGRRSVSIAGLSARIPVSVGSSTPRGRDSNYRIGKVSASVLADLSPEASPTVCRMRSTIPSTGTRRVWSPWTRSATSSTTAGSRSATATRRVRGKQDPRLVVQPPDRDQDRLAPGQGPRAAAGDRPRQPRRRSMSDAMALLAARPYPGGGSYAAARPLLRRPGVPHLDQRRARPAPPPRPRRQAPPRHLARRDARPRPLGRRVARDVPPLRGHGPHLAERGRVEEGPPRLQHLRRLLRRQPEPDPPRDQLLAGPAGRRVELRLADAVPVDARPGRHPRRRDCSPTAPAPTASARRRRSGGRSSTGSSPARNTRDVLYSAELGVVGSPRALQGGVWQYHRSRTSSRGRTPAAIGARLPRRLCPCPMPIRPEGHAGSSLTARRCSSGVSWPSTRPFSRGCRCRATGAIPPAASTSATWSRPSGAPRRAARSTPPTSPASSSIASAPTSTRCWCCSRRSGWCGRAPRCCWWRRR